MKNLQDTVTLHNGVEMPYLGLGVYKVEEGHQMEETVKTALDLGYRSLDTAAFYQNEEGVGKAIHSSGIDRKDLFITTKVWNDDQGYEETLRAFDESMNKLKLDYLDLYLVHWPVKGKYLETWRALEKLHIDGKVRAIGVSNFTIHHLEDLLKNSRIKPTVNQVELHPRLTQETLRSFCKEYEIAVEAWSPIGRGRLLNEQILTEIGKRHRKSAAQVILRWHLQNDVIIIPKSVTPARITENMELFDFELSQEEMELINTLNKDERFGPDPENFSF